MTLSSYDISIRLIRGLDGKRVGVLWSGGKSSTVLWDIIYSEMDDAVPIFVDHGLHPMETHELLHAMFRRGNFRPEIWRNDQKLGQVRDGKLDGLKYSMRDFRINKMLYADVLQQRVPGRFDVILTGSRMPRNRYGNIIEYRYDTLTVNPLFSWTEKEVWEYIRQHGILFNARYAKGWRIVDYADDPRSGDIPAWEYDGEYNEEEDRIDRLIRDNPIS